MDKGIYCLVLRNTACAVRVGALGQRSFAPGFHVYVGSAQGSGGLKRVSRHIRLARSRDRLPKWHIDYLLSSSGFVLCAVACARTDEKLECLLAETLRGVPVPLFGCSDCTCSSHLLYYPDHPQDQIITAFETLGLDPTIKTIIYPPHRL
jgi:Uri superfamily endonuclease